MSTAISLSAPPTSFETLSRPTSDEGISRLMYAARMASDDPVHDSVRWLGWLAWQTGMTLPLDLFTKLAESLDWLTYCEQYDTTAVPEAEGAVDHYRLGLVAMVYDKLGFPKKGR